MKVSDKYNITYDPASYTHRMLGLFSFYAFLTLLVWLSNGSTWWTFLFGSIALLALTVRIKIMYDICHNSFHTKAELLKFVNDLPDDNEAKS